MIAATDTTHSDNLRAIGDAISKTQKGVAGSLAIVLADSSAKFESSLKQLKLGYIPYILFFAVTSMSLLIFVLIFNCATSD